MSKIEHNENYDRTPSNPKSRSYFDNFLRKTSFYKGLQEAVKYCHKIADPMATLEFGSAFGDTLIKLSEQKYGVYVGIDNRKSVVDYANSKAPASCVFHCEDFENVAMQGKSAGGDINAFQFIYMLYSFHHIKDPLGEKTGFLQDMFKYMADGAYLCIAETFFPIDHDVTGLYNRREAETYASVYWAKLFEDAHIDRNSTEEVAEFAALQERKAGELVKARKDEYLIMLDWLTEMATEIGFEVVLGEYINNINDGVVLLRKPVKE